MIFFLDIATHSGAALKISNAESTDTDVDDFIVEKKSIKIFERNNSEIGMYLFLYVCIIC